MKKIKIFAGVLSLACVPQLATSGMARDLGHESEVAKLKAEKGDLSCYSDFDKRDPEKEQRGGRKKFGEDKKGRDNIAKNLTLLETEIGIRSGQVDAWRDFTDALLAVEASAGERQDGQVEPNDRGGETDKSSLAAMRQLAKDAIARGRSGESLLKAIDKLHQALTPKQLARLAVLETRLAPVRDGDHPPIGPGTAGSGFYLPDWKPDKDQRKYPSTPPR